jgi:hypothetical protein
MGKLEHAGNLVNKLNVERPYSEPGLLLGTSAFTADGWQGSFYPLNGAEDTRRDQPEIKTVLICSYDSQKRCPQSLR